MFHMSKVNSPLPNRPAKSKIPFIAVYDGHVVKLCPSSPKKKVVTPHGAAWPTTSLGKPDTLRLPRSCWMFCEPSWNARTLSAAVMINGTSPTLIFRVTFKRLNVFPLTVSPSCVGRPFFWKNWCFLSFEHVLGILASEVICESGPSSSSAGGSQWHQASPHEPHPAWPSWDLPGGTRQPTQTCRLCVRWLQQMILAMAFGMFCGDHVNWISIRVTQNMRTNVNWNPTRSSPRRLRHPLSPISKLTTQLDRKWHAPAMMASRLNDFFNLQK